ncbi:MAG TPA: HAD-IA family hydrolase [Candidatus Saccharimonadales bacterium]
MPKYSDFAAAIFDMDDTLLSNYPPGHPSGLHEESRLLAVHDVGKRRKIPELAAFTTEQNIRAFRDAPVHTLEGAVWNVLLMAGITRGEIDHANPLLREIVELKDKWHEKALRTFGTEVLGAKNFVHKLYSRGYEDRLAIASTAVRRDIFIALDIIGLRSLFPEKNIISKDMFTHPKPHPEAFKKAFQSLRLTVPPAKVLAFEDDPRGIMSAKGAGLFTCAITTRYSRKELQKLAVPPDLIADSYAEFERLLSMEFEHKDV